eukprot:SAG25_NODE_12652_length_277_cov_0.578652_1_plen_87_part_01
MRSWAEGHETPAPDANGERKLPGFCAAPRCFKPHDTCFVPCGHSICCDSCVNQLRDELQPICPVCGVAITGQELCYPEYLVDGEALC